MQAKRCYNCGREWTDPGRPTVRDVCPACHAYVRCCLNCRHYDPGMGNRCRSFTTEHVRDRDRANHCDEFEFGVSGGSGASGGGRESLDDLWKTE